MPFIGSRLAGWIRRRAGPRRRESGSRLAGGPRAPRSEDESRQPWITQCGASGIALLQAAARFSRGAQRSRKKR